MKSGVLIGGVLIFIFLGGGVFYAVTQSQGAIDEPTEMMKVNDITIASESDRVPQRELEKQTEEKVLALKERDAVSVVAPAEAAELQQEELAEQKVTERIYVESAPQIASSHDVQTVTVESEMLSCKDDGEILQWDGADDKWRCRTPERAVFHGIDDTYVDIASDGAIGCKGDEEFLYWNAEKEEWSCGTIGAGISVALEKLQNVNITPPLTDQVLQYNGTEWAPTTLAADTTLNLSYLTAGSALFYDGAKVAQDNDNFFWDNANNRLGIGTTSPSSALDINGTITATMAHTSIRDTGGQVCNVQAYGAVGDDATDNYSAITAAIAACPEAGVVLFPPGVYRVSQSIVLDRPVTLRGTHAPRWSYSSSPRTSIKPTTPFSGPAIVHVRDMTISGQADHNNGGKIENISIDGNSYGTDIVGIYFEGLVRDWDLEHVDISQTSGDGFRSDQGAGSGYPRGFTIEHLSIYSPEKHGFRAVALNDSYLEDVLVVGGAQRGFYITSIGETKFVGSRAVFNALEGLYIDGSTLNGGIQFTDFSTDRNDRHGVFVSATGTTTISFNGLLTRRDGKNDWGGTNPPYAGVAVIGTAGNKVAPVIISNLAQTPGINDDSTGEPSPSTGVRVEYAEYVSVEGVLWGVDTSYTDGGNNDHFIVQDKSLLKVGYSSVTSSIHANSAASFWNDVGSNNIAYITGNVGIGTTSPQKEVHISGEATPAMRMTDTTNTVSIDMRADDYQGFIGTSTNHDLRLMADGSSRMAILTNGNVGIGTNAPSETLHVAGNILATGTITPSDKNLKSDVEDLQSSLDKIIALNGVTYYYDQKKTTNQGFPDKKQYGVIAQDVEKVFPELVQEYTLGTEEEYKTVNYTGLIAPMIEAIKELDARIDGSARSISEKASELVYDVKATFTKMMTFAEEVVFGSRVHYADTDMGGYAHIMAGDQFVEIVFEKAFEELPVVSVNAFSSDVSYHVENIAPEKFRITLQRQYDDTVEFSWTALSITNAQTVQSQSASQ